MKILDLKETKSFTEILDSSKDKPVSEIANIMKDQKIGAVPITENGKLIGIVSERDIVTRLVIEGRDSDLTTAQEIMTTNIISVTDNDEINFALYKMRENNIRHMPVVDTDGKLTGFYSIRDFLKFKVNMSEQLKSKHKNLAKYQICVPAALIAFSFMSIWLDLFGKDNNVILFCIVFVLIGIFSVVTARVNIKYDEE
jgi:CBS domain-containing protein